LNREKIKLSVSSGAKHQVHAKSVPKIQIRVLARKPRTKLFQIFLRFKKIKQVRGIVV
jgi:hypothetical protein